MEEQRAFAVRSYLFIVFASERNKWHMNSVSYQGVKVDCGVQLAYVSNVCVTDRTSSNENGVKSLVFNGIQMRSK